MRELLDRQPALSPEQPAGRPGEVHAGVRSRQCLQKTSPTQPALKTGETFLRPDVLPEHALPALIIPSGGMAGRFVAAGERSGRQPAGTRHSAPCRQPHHASAPPAHEARRCSSGFPGARTACTGRLDGRFIDFRCVCFNRGGAAHGETDQAAGSRAACGCAARFLVAAYEAGVISVRVRSRGDEAFACARRGSRCLTCACWAPVG